MAIQDETAREGQRIAKVMARAGLCSRRDAEEWIAAGRVSVNGEVLTSPAINVSDADDIRVDGQPLASPERTRLFLFHKPKGLVTTAKDPEGRPTIFGALPEELPRVVAVGRLDINTEGLLLLTNDGGLSRVLELPATGWLRRYRVRAHGEITQEQLDGLRDGISIEGVNYQGIDAKFERQQGSNVWLTMGLREGKNREIKRVLEHMGLSVNRLIRVSFGPFELGDLAEGEVVEVRTKVLRDQLGPKLAKQAGANFDAPLEAPAPPPEEPPRGDRPLRRKRDEPSAGPVRKRKHVSVLRAEAREEAAGPRKRITRATTADRKGREVQIERVSLAKRTEEAPTRMRRGERPPRRAAEGSERREAGAERRPPRRAAGEGFAKRAPREATGERPPREATGERRFERAPRLAAGEGYEKRERPPREGAGERRFDRPPRRAAGEGFEKRERAPREGAGERRFDRPPRRAAGEGFEKRERPPRAETGERRSGGPPRRDAGEGFKPRTATGERPPRRGPGGPRPPRDGKPPGGKGGPRKPRGG